MDRADRTSRYQQQSRIADEMAEQGKKDESLSLLQSLRDEAAAAGDKDYEAFFEAELINYSSGGHARAAQRLAEGIGQAKPGGADAFLLHSLGAYHSQKGDQDAAIALYDQALAENPKDWEAMRNKGVALAEKGDQNAAIACYDQALAENPKDWNAMRNKGVALAKKGNEDAAIALFDQALAENPKDWNAMRNKGVTLAKKGDEDAAIAWLDQALAENPKDGDAMRQKGVSLANKGDLDAAIAWLDQALAENPKDWDAMRNKGVALAKKGDEDAAIAWFDQALAENPKDWDAMRNKGVALSRKGDEDAAIAWFDQALAENPNDGQAMCCKGISFSKNNNSKDANIWFDKALASPGFAWEAETRLWMGNTFAREGNNPQAVECWKKAAELFRAKGQKNDASLAELKIVVAEKDPKQRSPRDRAALTETTPVPGAGGDHSPERRILDKLDNVEQTKYDEYDKQYDAAPREEEVLAVLRGWGSAVGLLPAKGGSPCRGGGYLLKWAGKGLLVDPGFDCLSNLHEEGFHCREVNAVVVSHNHPDHNDDLRSFDDIRYEMYWRAKRAKDEVACKAWEYMLLWDKDTEEKRKFDVAEAEHRLEKIMETNPRGLDPKHHDLRDLPFRIHWFKVKHSEDVPHAVGVRVDCLKPDRTTAVTVGFTCDTAFFSDLSNEDHLGGCDILIAHISMPNREEYTDSNYLKTGHLGYRGVEKLIKAVKPKLAIVGEFWSGIADLRIDLVAGLRELCKPHSIIPASIGLQLKPGTREIRCTNCRKWTGLSEIRIGSPAMEFGSLSYLCPHCRLE